MTEEEYFRKNYPDYCYGDRLLSPYWDLFQDGVEFGEQQSEKKIDKMKCCENCKYNSYWGNELHCNYGLKEALQEDKLVDCKNMDKWEIKE